MQAKQSLTIPLTPSAILARAAAGLGMTVPQYLNRTFGDILPPVPPKALPAPATTPAPQPTK